MTVRNVGAPSRSTSTATGSSSPPYGYAFPRDSVLQPGEEMTIETQRRPGSRTRALEKHWGEPRSILNDGGDRIRLTSFRGVVLDCYAYGSGAC